MVSPLVKMCYSKQEITVPQAQTELEWWHVSHESRARNYLFTSEKHHTKESDHNDARKTVNDVLGTKRGA
jgi:hypothetical protein